MAHLKEIAPEAEVHLVYHGLNADFARLVGETAPPQPASNGTLRVLGVGRLVAKNGFDVIVEACAELRRRDLPFEALIVGQDDKHGDVVRDRIAALGLGDRVASRARRDFTFVGDVVAAARAAAVADGVAGEAYNIGGGSRVSLAATLELLAGIAGRPLDIRRHRRESGDVQDTGADIKRARDALGFSPATDLGTGLRAEFEWVCAHSPYLGVLPAASGG